MHLYGVLSLTLEKTPLYTWSKLGRNRAVYQLSRFPELEKKWTEVITVRIRMLSISLRLFSIVLIKMAYPTVGYILFAFVILKSGLISINIKQKLFSLSNMWYHNIIQKQCSHYIIYVYIYIYIYMIVGLSKYPLWVLNKFLRLRINSNIIYNIYTDGKSIKVESNYAWRGEISLHMALLKVETISHLKVCPSKIVSLHAHKACLGVV